MVSQKKIYLNTNSQKAYYLSRAVHRACACNSGKILKLFTTSWEAGATDERIQVEMCFTHTALEYLIIVSTPKLSLRIFYLYSKINSS